MQTITQKPKSLTHAALSVGVFGAYMMLNGLGLMIDPNASLRLFGFPSTSEVWLRVVGLLSLSLGLYYVLAARSGLVPLLRWSVYIRPLGLIGLGMFVFARLAPPMLLSFGLADLISAVWTYWALRRIS